MGKKQGKSGIEWCDYTSNMVLGRCPMKPNCHYCYMTSFYHRFGIDETIRLSEKELKWHPRTTGQRIFVGSNLDLFHPDIPHEWKQAIVEKAIKDKQNVYMFLTKLPREYGVYCRGVYPNIWWGTTWDGTERTLRNLVDLYSHAIGNLFASFEPLLAEPAVSSGIDLDWIIIGADSRPGAKKPPIEWAEKLVRTGKVFHIPVFIKSNYGYPKKIQQWPDSMMEYLGRIRR